MKKKDIKSGDIISIPLDNDKYAIAKIMFLSIRYKNVILLSVYPLLTSSSELLEVAYEINHELLIYTGLDPIRKEEWRKVANCSVNEEEKQLSTRIIAGSVWVEDEYLRNATENDRATFKKMEVYGTILVKRTIIEYLTTKKLIQC